MLLFAYVDAGEIIAFPLNRDSLYACVDDFCSYIKNKYSDNGWHFDSSIHHDALETVFASIDVSISARKIIDFMNEYNGIGDIYCFPQILEI